MLLKKEELVPRLADFQSQFEEAVFNPAPGSDVTNLIDDDGLLEDRLNVYRNNVFYSLTGSLSDLYPAVTKLVGEEFFRAMAAEFVRQSPPTTGRILEYGANFANFVHKFEPAKPLPYLSDVARLEWAWHSAYHGADRDVLNPEKLQSFPPERMAEICFELHPTSQFVQSQYPIDLIWSANQEGAEDQSIDLDARGALIHVVRPEQEVEVRLLSKGAYAFLRGCSQGQNLGEAYEAAVDVEPELDLTRLLSDFLSGSTFVEATIDKE